MSPVLGQRQRSRSWLVGLLILTGAVAAVLLFAPASDAPQETCRGKPATILGTDRADALIGTSERDVIVAGRGNDIIKGLGGNDLIYGGAGKDIIDGGPSNDEIFTGGGNDKATGNEGADLLEGGAGDDRLRGGSGPDATRGQRGTDGWWPSCASPASGARPPSVHLHSCSSYLLHARPASTTARAA